MTDLNGAPEQKKPNAQPGASQTAAAGVPALTLDASSIAQDHVILDEAVKSLEQGETPKAVEASLADMDASMLTADEKKTIEAFIGQIDIENPDHVLLFGAEAQKKIADFSDSALASVRTNQTGEVGEMLVRLVNEIKGFGDAAEEPKGVAKLFWNAKKAVTDLKTKYEKVEANVGAISTGLESHQTQLLKDVSLFNHLYDMNTQYFRELTMYIIAGGQKLANVRGSILQEWRDKAAASGDAMDAQRANDLAAACDRFEKKLHDLKLTRQVSLQMAPQIRLLQSNNSLLVERIQSTLSNTLPLWKSQIVLALGLQHSQEALSAQRAVTDMTNELLKKNAETLKMGTIQTAQEAERGVIDLHTLAQTNQSLIDTIQEVMRIQGEGRANRLEAEKALVAMEGELKQKLLTLRN